MILIFGTFHVYLSIFPTNGLFPKVSTLHPISVLLWVGRIFFVPGEIELRYDKF